MSAWRTPPKSNPLTRAAPRVFELVQSKSVGVVEPKGLVEVKIPTFALFRHKSAQPRVSRWIPPSARRVISTRAPRACQEQHRQGKLACLISGRDYVSSC